VVSQDLVNAVMALAKLTVQRKARLCMHPSPSDDEQQMLLAINRDYLDKAHYHPDKAETLIWVGGRGEHETLSDTGVLMKKTVLGPGHVGYVHTSAGVPHRVIARSEVLIFWEFSRGPFGQNSTLFTEAST
jgi:cupin fold WbuC family metalloprotein